MPVIKVEHLTKDFGSGRGIFDVNLEVNEGEVLGFLGPNGAGKTTTIRHLLGFTKPDKGNSYIFDKDTKKHHSQILKDVGYLPGEVALPEALTGIQFLDMMAEMKQLKDNKKRDDLLERFELNPNQSTKRMSIGEKRKLAVVAAFMHDPQVLILDEPTSGLDPIMQDQFIRFMLNEKSRGKTILLSSHIFSEVDALSDRISIIKEGKIISNFKTEEIRNTKRKTFEIYFKNSSDIKEFEKKCNYEVVEMNLPMKQLVINLEKEELNNLISILRSYDLSSFLERPFTLESYFMHFYKSGKSFGGIKNG
ncbi:MAG: ABC transporter ATP-binding protein [Lactococcus chungangensis]|jgi:ABC-2 type transport system ATP-binding protein